MCRGCVAEQIENEIGEEPTYEQVGEAITTVAARPAVAAAVREIEALYQLPDCDNGGPLHIVVEDSNVDDAHLVPWRPDDEPDYWGPDTYAQADRVVAALRPLTKLERVVATVAHRRG